MEALNGQRRSDLEFQLQQRQKKTLRNRSILLIVAEIALLTNLIVLQVKQTDCAAQM